MHTHAHYYHPCARWDEKALGQCFTQASLSGADVSMLLRSSGPKTMLDRACYYVSGSVLKSSVTFRSRCEPPSLVIETQPVIACYSIVLYSIS